jgi:hypothetical protein
MNIYHGGTEIVEAPRIIEMFTGRDFGTGFYTTDIIAQAVKWAKRQARYRKTDEAVLNIYEFDNVAFQALKVKTFDGYVMEWLDFVVSSRQDVSFLHGYDLVIGKVANDDVGETIQAVVDGLMPKDFALTRLAFMHAYNQICLSTEKALKHLKFVSAERVN